MVVLSLFSCKFPLHRNFKTLPKIKQKNNAGKYLDNAYLWLLVLYCGLGWCIILALKKTPYLI